jgi:hypothetical protein
MTSDQASVVTNTVPVDSTAGIVSGLENGTRYNFTIQPVNVDTQDSDSQTQLTTMNTTNSTDTSGWYRVRDVDDSESDGSYDDAAPDSENTGDNVSDGESKFTLSPFDLSDSDPDSTLDRKYTLTKFRLVPDLASYY